VAGYFVRRRELRDGPGRGAPLSTGPQTPASDTFRVWLFRASAAAQPGRGILWPAPPRANEELSETPPHAVQ
jgi:hypothetical protein